ncbi:AAA family ATPase [bacterium]|nr:AAA family ATPase [bacterium]
MFREIYFENWPIDYDNRKEYIEKIQAKYGYLEKYLSVDGHGMHYRLTGLSKVNIFVGPNNSGKSRFLRELLMIKDYKVKIDYHWDYAFYNKSILLRLSRLIELVIKENKTIFSDEEHKMFLQSASKKINHGNSPTILSDLFNKIMTGYERDSGYLPHLHAKAHHEIDYFLENGILYLEDGKFILNDTVRNEFNFLNNRIYIPILRGLRPFDSISVEDKDIYYQRTEKDYFPREKDLDEPIPKRTDFTMYTGLTFYEELRKHLLGDQPDRDRIKRYEHFLSTEFFNDQLVTLIPKLSSDVINVKIGNEEYPIYELGDGIQSIILITFPLFMEEEGIFFIEEPELFLHPEMQRRLVEVLTDDERWPKAVFFITTHSNHLLDLSLNNNMVSLFTVNKKPEFTIEKPRYEVQHRQKPDQYMMSLLGVRNTSVMLSNCTIWVEGITDILYLRKWLEIFMDHHHEHDKTNQIFVESTHFTFMEYHGCDSLRHWGSCEEEGVEINSFTRNILLIKDNDSQIEENSKNDIVYKKNMKIDKRMKQIFGDDFILLDNGEIENYISTKVLKEKFIKDKVDIKIDFKENDFKLRKLFKYLDGYLKEKKYQGNKKYETGKKRKKPFCRDIVSLTTEWDDLSEEAKKLTKKIYSFIKKHNS